MALTETQQRTLLEKLSEVNDREIIDRKLKHAVDFYLGAKDKQTGGKGLLSVGRYKGDGVMVALYTELEGPNAGKSLMFPDGPFAEYKMLSRMVDTEQMILDRLEVTDLADMLVARR